MKRVYFFAMLLFWSFFGQGYSLFAMDYDEGTLPDSPNAARYCFLQQFNDMCMIAPMINLKLLEDFLKNHGGEHGGEDDDTSLFKKLPEEKWFTRRQWFGKAYPYLIAWHRALQETTAADREWEPSEEKFVEKPKHEALYNFVKRAIEDGPTLPHFYNQDGTFFFTGKKEMKLGYFQASAAMRFAYTPYLFIDNEAMSLIKGDLAEFSTGGINLPLVRSINDKFYVFNQDSNVFDFIQNTDAINYSSEYSSGGHTSRIIEDVSILKTDKASLQDPCYASIGEMPKNSIYTFTAPKTGSLGFKEVFGVSSGEGQGVMLSDGVRTKLYASYMFGLYKMMLLRLGIDSNNEDINEDHEFFHVCQGLQMLCNQDPHRNPWSDVYFSRDNFLTYQISLLLDKDKELRDAVKATVDFSALHQWSVYKDFLKAVKNGTIYRDRDGEKPYEYDNVMKYIPGKTQALSSILLAQIRFLWYGTLNKKAYYEFTIPQNNILVRFFTRVKKMKFSQFKDQAFSKRSIGEEKLSFIDVWNRIVERLKGAFERRNWVSFDGHGWVVSFDERLIEAQKDKMNSTLSGTKLKAAHKLLDALGCVGIESSHSSFLNSFYKK